MNRVLKNKIVIAVIALVVLLGIFAVIALMGIKPKEAKTKIGFIMSGSADEAGWNGMHYAGVREACDKLGVELLVKENVKEFTGACNEAIRELVADGAGMIVLSSYNYSEEAIETVKQYPEIVFYGNSSEYHEENLTSYFVRMYQARYLSGIIAGMRTRTNAVGYVAAMPNNEVNRGINAFTLGVKRVNPDATVTVAWTGSWDDEAAEKEAAQKLIEQGQADVLTYHQNKTYVVEVAEKAGIDSIGYHEAPNEHSQHYLTAVVCDWTLAYEEVIRTFMRGKGNSVPNYWIGLEEGVVGLSAYSDEVSEEISQEIEAAKSDILSGDDVFSGIIYDNTGALRCAEKETISDEILLERFDWYVEGVEFYEK